MNLAIFVHPTSFIDSPCKIGYGTRIWHFTHIMSNCIIGQNCNIGQNMVVSPDVAPGKHSGVEKKVSIYTGMTCEDDDILGPSMVFTGRANPRREVNPGAPTCPTLVKRGVTIGANAIIKCGIILGEYCFIGAGVVVTRDVPDYAVVLGNRARHTGWMSEFGHRLHFNESGEAVCPESKTLYLLRDGHVNRVQ